MDKRLHYYYYFLPHRAPLLVQVLAAAAVVVEAADTVKTASLVVEWAPVASAGVDIACRCQLHRPFCVAKPTKPSYGLYDVHF